MVYANLLLARTPVLLLSNSLTKLLLCLTDKGPDDFQDFDENSTSLAETLKRKMTSDNWFKMRLVSSSPSLN